MGKFETFWDIEETEPRTSDEYWDYESRHNRPARKKPGSNVFHRLAIGKFRRIRAQVKSGNYEAAVQTFRAMPPEARKRIGGKLSNFMLEHCRAFSLDDSSSSFLADIGKAMQISDCERGLSELCPDSGQWLLPYVIDSEVVSIIGREKLGELYLEKEQMKGDPRIHYLMRVVLSEGRRLDPHSTVLMHYRAGDLSGCYSLDEKLIRRSPFPDLLNGDTLQFQVHGEVEEENQVIATCNVRARDLAPKLSEEGLRWFYTGTLYEVSLTGFNPNRFRSRPELLVNGNGKRVSYRRVVDGNGASFVPWISNKVRKLANRGKAALPKPISIMRRKYHKRQYY